MPELEERISCKPRPAKACQRSPVSGPQRPLSAPRRKEPKGAKASRWPSARSRGVLAERRARREASASCFEVGSLPFGGAVKEEPKQAVPEGRLKGRLGRRRQPLEGLCPPAVRPGE